MCKEDCIAEVFESKLDKYQRLFAKTMLARILPSSGSRLERLCRSLSLQFKLAEHERNAQKVSY